MKTHNFDNMLCLREIGLRGGISGSMQACHVEFGLAINLHCDPNKNHIAALRELASAAYRLADSLETQKEGTTTK